MTGSGKFGTDAPEATFKHHRVFQYLYQATEPRTKRQIATDLGLSLPTVTKELNSLEEQGLTMGKTQERVTVGRPPVGICISPMARVAIGVFVSEHHFRLVAADLFGNELADATYRHLPRLSPDQLSSETARSVERFIKEEHVSRDGLLGVGLALPGIVDEESGEVLKAPTLGFDHIPAETLLGDLPYHSVICNDANCAGFAEWFDAPVSGSIAFLLLENGVGGALILDGSPYLGSNGRAGEFGHMNVHPGGKRCSCGKTGCLEAYCSTSLLSDDMGISLEEFFGRLSAGDGQATKAWEEYERHLAIGINDIRMAFDCDLIIGGEIAQYLEPHLESLERRIGSLDPFEDETGHVRLSRRPLHAVPRGAAERLVSEFVESV